MVMMVVRYCGDHYCGDDVSDNSGDVGQLW